MLGTLSATLYTASATHDSITRAFAAAYGVMFVSPSSISCRRRVQANDPSLPPCSALFVLVYGYAIFQKRITLISKRSGLHFGLLIPPAVSQVPLSSTD